MKNKIDKANKFFIRESENAGYKVSYTIVKCKLLESMPKTKIKNQKIWVQYGDCNIKSMVSTFRIFNTYKQAEQNLEKVKELIYKERNPIEFGLKK